jgi:hypothetical protein
MVAFLLAGLLVGQAPLSRAETLKLVKDDLAHRLKVEAGDLEVVAESDETWPDSALGCAARKPLDEPVRTPGFAFTLSSRDRSYVYHADRRGNIRRCDTAKPPARIVR